VYEFPPLITVRKVSYCRTPELTAWFVGVHNNSNISSWSVAMHSFIRFKQKVERLSFEYLTEKRQWEFRPI